MPQNDFSSYPLLKKPYGGANGKKLCILIEGERHMLKLSHPADRTDAMSYGNDCISEYIGCQLFNQIGIPAQETLLGTYTIPNHKPRFACACKDFTSPGWSFKDFASLKNQVLDTGHSGKNTDLNEVLETIASQQAVDPAALETRFWDVFIVDALIGNWDRHNGNWGFLYNDEQDAFKIAPVFDCGSALFPQADAELIERMLTHEGTFNDRVYNRPLSALQANGKRLNYHQFLTESAYPACNDALKRIVPRISTDMIECVVDGTPLISDQQKTFYKKILIARKELILDFALSRLTEKETPQTGKTKQGRLFDNLKRLTDASEHMSSGLSGSGQHSKGNDR